jgi:hypothetical protein
MCFCAGVLVIREDSQNALAEPMKLTDLFNFAQNLLFPGLMTVSVWNIHSKGERTVLHERTVYHLHGTKTIIPDPDCGTNSALYYAPRHAIR